MNLLTAFFSDHPGLTVALLWIGAALATAAVFSWLAGDAFDVETEDDDHNPDYDSENRR